MSTEGTQPIRTVDLSADLTAALTPGQKVALGRTRGVVDRVYRCEDSVIVVTRDEHRGQPIYSVTVPSGQQFPWAEMDPA